MAVQVPFSQLSLSARVRVFFTDGIIDDTHVSNSNTVEHNNFCRYTLINSYFLPIRIVAYFCSLLT